jgi:hypothetical protein
MIISDQLLMACFAQEKHAVSTGMSIMVEVIVIRQECQLLYANIAAIKLGKVNGKEDVVITVHSPPPQ